jgi:hypothetical protein
VAIIGKARVKSRDDRDISTEAMLSGLPLVSGVELGVWREQAMSKHQVSDGHGEHGHNMFEV